MMFIYIMLYSYGVWPYLDPSAITDVITTIVNCGVSEIIIEFVAVIKGSVDPMWVCSDDTAGSGVESSLVIDTMFIDVDSDGGTPMAVVSINIGIVSVSMKITTLLPLSANMSLLEGSDYNNK